MPWGILIGGEELHNNHHAYGSSAKFSSRWFEFDLGWVYIRILETLRLAKVRRVAPTLHVAPTPKPVPDLATLHAVIEHRYTVVAAYARSLRATCAAEIAALRSKAGRAELPGDAEPRAPEALAVVRVGRHACRSPSARRSPRRWRAARRCRRSTRCARTWTASGSARPKHASSSSPACRTGAVAPRQSGIASLAQFSQQLRRYA